MSEKKLPTTDQAIQIFAEVYERLVWLVRCEDYGVLKLEFGAPRLRILEPMTRRRKTEDGSFLPVTRRVAQPEGQWHLFVEGGHWRVEAGGYSCARTDELPLEQRAFLFLNGQKLMSVARADGEWLFEFEFGGRLSIKPAPPDPEPDPDPAPQWILFFKAGGCLYCDERGLFLE